MLAGYQKHQKSDILASQNRYFGSLSAHLCFLECHNAHTELPRDPDACFPGTWCQDTWSPGTRYLAVWSKTPSRARPFGGSGPFSLGFPVWGEPPKSSKIVICWLHAATQPKCHESILFATFAPCLHGTKNIKKSTFWHPKIDTFGASVHILASWQLGMGIVGIPGSQDAH